MSDNNTSPNENPVQDNSAVDAYYGESEAASDEVDLSFLDDEAEK